MLHSEKANLHNLGTHRGSAGLMEPGNHAERAREAMPDGEVQRFSGSVECDDGKVGL